MDEISLHPYPNNAADSLETGYRWPNAGVPNMARIKQAVWDAFNGTAQPIFAEPGAPLRTMMAPSERGRLAGRDPARLAAPTTA